MEFARTVPLTPASSCASLRAARAALPSEASTPPCQDERGAQDDARPKAKAESISRARKATCGRTTRTFGSTKPPRLFVTTHTSCSPLRTRTGIAAAITREASLPSASSVRRCFCFLPSSAARACVTGALCGLQVSLLHAHRARRQRSKEARGAAPASASRAPNIRALSSTGCRHREARATRLGHAIFAPRRATRRDVFDKTLVQKLHLIIGFACAARAAHLEDCAPPSRM